MQKKWGNLKNGTSGSQYLCGSEIPRVYQAVEEAGVDFVSTANNHCMDRGLDGLKRTITILDAVGLSHDGTHIDIRENEPFIADVMDTRVAIIPFTYGTNYGMHHKALPDKRYVDLLHDDTAPVYVTGKKGTLSKIKSILFKPLKTEQIAAIKKSLSMEYNKARKDDYLNEEEVAPYFARLKTKIERAKELADVVVFYPHVGGQFNLDPGRFTEYTVKKALSMVRERSLHRIHMLFREL